MIFEDSIGFSIKWNSNKNRKMFLLTITGRMWDIWPVSSNTITDVEIVWVTLPERAAAPEAIKHNFQVSNIDAQNKWQRKCDIRIQN